MTTPTFAERLNDPSATFTTAEIYQAFEELAERFGFYRDQRLPERNSVDTTTMIVDDFERLGPLIVRPKTNLDNLVTIPGEVDAILGGNMNPSQTSFWNATAIAIARVCIVSPPGVVETILKSTDIEDLQFFRAFAEQHQAWQDGLSEAARGKPSGTEPRDDGKNSSSPSDSTTDSPPQTPDGSR